MNRLLIAMLSAAMTAPSIGLAETMSGEAHEHDKSKPAQEVIEHKMMRLTRSTHQMPRMNMSVMVIQNMGLAIVPTMKVMMMRDTAKVILKKMDMGIKKKLLPLRH